MSGFPNNPVAMRYHLCKPQRPIGPCLRRQGFTMIELLVAMSVLVVIMAMVSQFMGMTFRSVSEARKRFEVQAKARNALDLIARDLHDGVFQKQLTAFTDDTGSVALAFYTSHLGLIGPSDDLTLYRPLSYVVYRTVPPTPSGFTTLYRGAVSLQWDLSATYPALPPDSNALPFQIANGNNDLYVAATTTGNNYQKLIEGVIRMEVGFLYDDGVVRTTFNIDPGSSTPPAPVAKAAIITLLIASDTDTQKLLSGSSDPLAAYFGGASSPLAARDAVSAPSLLAEWEKVLNNPTTWSGFPDGISSGVRAYERIVYLP